jgi:nitrite reductase (NADH) small subunit
MNWMPVCPYPSLEPERGVAALVDGDPVAVFRLHDGSVAAIGNVDPYTGASVLSRGLVGSRGDAPTVASPLHKQVYDLRTGTCLDDPALRVPVYPVRLRDGVVEIHKAAA